MEILYWFLFFFIMIFLSILNWFEIFLVFLLVIILTNAYLQQDKIMVSIVDGVSDLSNKITESVLNTQMGIYFYKLLLQLDEAYQNTKNIIKQHLFKILLSSPLRRNTPRLSYDTDDTDDE